MIPLAILCAVLEAIAAIYFGWQADRANKRAESMRVQRDKFHQSHFEDSQLLSEAYALLHDERHKGKMGNQAAWIAARDEWAAKVKGVEK